MTPESLSSMQKQNKGSQITLASPCSGEANTKQI